MRRMRSGRRGRAVWMAAWLLALAGCGQPPTLWDREVKAGSGATLINWRARVLETYPKTERAEFDAALQELRFIEMGRRAALSASVVDALVRERIDGLKVREVLVVAYEARWKRLEEEQKLLRGVIELNVGRVPVTPEAEVRLEFHLAQQVKRLDEVTAELERIESRLEALGARLSRPPTKPATRGEPGAPSGPGGSGSGSAGAAV